MNWRFTLIESDATETQINEPVGWDGIACNFTRNLISHGVFTNIATESFEFIDTAYDLLFTEYNTNGANGQMQIRIEYECGENEGYTEYFTGNFDFNTFERQCADYCFIKCSVTASKCVDVFTSRMGQDVDVLSTTNFDGEAITPMAFTSMLMEGQDIFLQNKTYNTDGSVFNISGSYPTTGTKNLYIPIYLPNTPISEIGDFAINNITQFIVEKPGFDGINFANTEQWLAYGQNLAIWNRTSDPLNCIDNDATIEFRCKGEFEINTNFNGNVTVTLVFAKYDENTNTFAAIDSQTVTGGVITVTSGVPIIETFDLSFSNTPAYEESQWLLYYWSVIWQVNTGSPSNFTFDLTYDAGNDNNYFTMELDSNCDATDIDTVQLPDLLEWLPTAYMSTECPLLEIETNLRECLDGYSITKGSFIRNVTEPSVPKLFINYEWLFDQCRKIFNIGWGFDNNETELKIGNIEDFYQSTIVADVGLLDKATFTTAQDLIYGTITIGYNKWEAEEYNGLDETNTERQYRRNVDSNPTELDLMADIISAGYTIEITRRKDQAKTGTSDWRYDDDIFIINSYTSYGTLFAYRGTSDAANLYSPSTRMNLRLTPVRNLMRWFKSIAAAQPTLANESEIFTSGTGNYIAESRFADDCFIETGIVTENQTVISTDVTDPDPTWKTIYASFNAPFSMTQFEAMKVNPYGAIRFRCSDDIYIGNVVELSHDPNTGLASFKLLLRR